MMGTLMQRIGFQSIYCLFICYPVLGGLLLSGCGGSASTEDEIGRVDSFATKGSSKTLTITIDDPALVPTAWQYRELTTRTWAPGCYQYDVLQGSGWFPMTFYKDIEPSVSVDQRTYTYVTGDRSWMASYCGATMDKVGNYVFVELIDRNGNLIAAGTFNVIGEGATNHADVRCRVQPQPDSDRDLLVCPDALVGSGPIFQVNLIMER